MKEEEDMREEKVLLNATLCFPVRGDEILLGLKAKKIGRGCLNGYGGGVEEGETEKQSMVRELREESQVVASEENLEKVAIIDFHNMKSDGEVFVCRVHVYFLRDWEGEFEETDEMLQPTWYKKSAVPYERMMLADRFWVPPVIEGRKVVGKAKYGPYQETLLEDVELKFVDSID